MKTVVKLTTLGGRIICPRCQAMSKRTRKQCGAPAMRGKRVCRFHGGLSSGLKSAEGRECCAAAKTIHGRETRQIRQKRSEGLAELAKLEVLGFACGLLVGSRSRGPKPRGRS